MPQPEKNPPIPGKRSEKMDTQEIRRAVLSTIDSRVVVAMSGIIAAAFLGLCTLVLGNWQANTRQDEALNGVKEGLSELKTENRANFSRLEALIRAAK